MICEKCNNIIPNDSEFCPFCGTKVVSKNEDRIDLGVDCFKQKSYKNVINRSRKVLIWISIAMILPVISNIVCLNFKDIDSNTDMYYFISTVFCILTIICLFVNSKIQKYNNILIGIASVLLIGSGIPFLFNEILEDAKYIIVFLIISIFVILFSLISCVVFAIIWNIYIYRKSAYYSLKCYQKLSKMNTLKEEGIIADNEYIEIKNKILSGIISE